MKLLCVGGHLAPLLAIIDVLPKDVELVVLGRKQSLEGDTSVSLEYQTLTSRGTRFVPVVTGRLQRKFTKHTIPSLLKIPIGFFQAWKAVVDFKPDVVLCFGGYVSMPVAVTSYFLGIPVVIHEQTTEAGFANKFISLFAKKVCISWGSSIKFFPKTKTVLTGNPIRKFTITNLQLPISKENVPLIYITGGSSGSHTINMLVKGCIEKLLENFLVIHQTGDSKEFQDYDKLKKLRETFDKKIKDRYTLTKFVEPKMIGSILRYAHLAVSRSGINTVTELIYFGTPCFLIPLNNEQLKNARMFKNLGLGEIGIQEKLTSDELYSRILEMSKNIKTYKESAAKAQKLVKIDAAEHIISVLNAVVKP